MADTCPEGRVLELLAPVETRTAWDWRGNLRRGRKGGVTVRLPAGAWLLELGPVELPDWLGQGPVEYRYRLADGMVIALNTPLDEARVGEVAHPQAVTAMKAFRGLDEILVADYGLEVGFIDNNLQPFALIRCPLCRGTHFTTSEFAQVFCGDCGATFSVRQTAGDPGFVVDCNWPGGLHPDAIYQLPPAEHLLMTLVLKNSGDPRDLRHSPRDCSDGCRPDALRLTDGHTGLRAGLHACKIGDLYDYDLYGTPPTREEMQRLHWGGGWEIEGERWPMCASVDPGPLRQVPSLMAESPLPAPEGLREGEHLLLHSFQRLEIPNSGAWSVPIWEVVRFEQRDPHDQWQVVVVRANVCPICGHAVEPGDLEVRGKLWDIPHGRCRDGLARLGWKPVFETAAGAA